MIKSFSRGSVFDRLEEIIWVGMSLVITGCCHIFIDQVKGVLTLLTISTLLQALWHHLFLVNKFRYFVWTNFCFGWHWVKGILFGHGGELLLVSISERRQGLLSQYDPPCRICLLLLALYLKRGTTDVTSLLGATWLSQINLALNELDVERFASRIKPKRRFPLYFPLLPHVFLL